MDATQQQYVMVKTSVWWDIENCHVPKGCDPHAIAQNMSSALVKMNYCGPVSISAYGDTNRIPSSVQQALSSTGIALNHVPAGAKDASDKKILVDMLFWAVDNPAPANYLLISGDRDFSNALHQLRMRRYNILLAQPLKASAALVAAATIVWHWSTLVAGGTSLASSELLNSSNKPHNETSPTSVPETISTDQFSYPQANILTRGDEKLANPGRTTDVMFKAKYIPRNPNPFNITRASSMTVGIFDHFNPHNPQQPESSPAKQFKKAPHEFFGPSHNTVSSSRSAPDLFPGNLNSPANSLSNLPNQFNQPPDVLHPGNLFVQSSHNKSALSFLSGPDVPRKNAASSFLCPADSDKMNILEYPRCSGNASSFNQKSGKDQRSNFMDSPSLACSSGTNGESILHASESIYCNTLDNKDVHLPELRPTSSMTMTAFQGMVTGDMKDASHLLNMSNVL